MTRRDEIVEVTRRLLEDGGWDSVTMQAIADVLGIRAPSLYKHIDGKRDLEIAIIADGFTEQAAAFEDAVAGSSDPLASIASTYRAFALARPYLYRLMTDRPLPRAELPEGLEARAAAPVLDAVDGDVDRARALWAFAHGMVTLELAGRFPSDADLDAAWEIGIRAFTDKEES